MLEVFRFIFKCIAQFISMLFTVDLGFTSLGVLMCIIYILLPIMLFIVNFIKVQLMDELDDRFDEKRPRETWSSNEYQWDTAAGSTRNYGRRTSTSHIRSMSRRYKL